MLTQAQIDTAHDHEPNPCETCDGTGWIMDNEDLHSPCPACEDHDAAVRGELDAELDAMRWHAAMDQLDGHDLEDQLDMLLDGEIAYPF